MRPKLADDNRMVIHLHTGEEEHRRAIRVRSGRRSGMRRAIIIAIVFLIVVLMALTSLGLFGQEFADAVRHLIRG